MKVCRRRICMAGLTALVSGLIYSFDGVYSVSTRAKAGTRSIVCNKSVPGLKNGMDYTNVGSSDLVVSKVCMGTMTFGNQNTMEEGVEQLNLAWDEYGINLLDTAEMYPVPVVEESNGSTDRTIGEFLKGRKREDVVLATKVAGRSDRLTFLRKNRDEEVRVNRGQILESVDASLQRLGTDYIDLLQIHWPDRYVPLFGSSDFIRENIKEDTISFEEQLSTFKELIDAGKVRYLGVSNETPYGVSEMVRLAKEDAEKYAKIVSIQNSYSLLVRKDYEAGLAEMCHYHGVGLLPYSPLAGGVLSGKYSNPDVPVGPKARLKLFPGFMDRYLGSQAEAATLDYAKIARKAGLTPAQLALSWCFQREHVCSTIVGATQLDQLKEDIESYDVKLDDDILKQIHQVYKKYTDPTKAY